MSTEPDPPSPAQPPLAPEPPPRLYTTAELFQGRRDIRLEHDGVIYHLRITRKNRLILHK